MLTTAASGAAPLPPSPPATTTATKPDDRAVFDRELAIEKWGFLFRLPIGFWSPSLAEVAKLEARLPDYLRAELDPPLPPKRGPRRKTTPKPPQPTKVPLWKRAFAYQRQYVGLMKDGHHLIWANFFCRPVRADWRHEPVVVDDGGDCFFQVEYDVDTGKFSNLAVNGKA